MTQFAAEKSHNPLRRLICNLSTRGGMGGYSIEPICERCGHDNTAYWSYVDEVGPEAEAFDEKDIPPYCGCCGVCGCCPCHKWSCAECVWEYKPVFRHLRQWAWGEDKVENV